MRRWDAFDPDEGGRYDEEPGVRVGGMHDVHDGDAGQRLAQSGFEEQAASAGRGGERLQGEADGLFLVFVQWGFHARAYASADGTHMMGSVEDVFGKGFRHV